MMTIVSDFQIEIIEQLLDRKKKLELALQNIESVADKDSIEFHILYLVAQSDLFMDVIPSQIKDNEIIAAMKGEFGRDAVKAAIKKLTEQKFLIVPKPKPTRYAQHKLNKILLK